MGGDTIMDQGWEMVKGAQDEELEITEEAAGDCSVPTTDSVEEAKSSLSLSSHSTALVPINQSTDTTSAEAELHSNPETASPKVTPYRPPKKNTKLHAYLDLAPLQFVYDEGRKLWCTPKELEANRLSRHGSSRNTEEGGAEESSTRENRKGDDDGTSGEPKNQTLHEKEVAGKTSDEASAEPPVDNYKNCIHLSSPKKKSGTILETKKDEEEAAPIVKRESKPSLKTTKCCFNPFNSLPPKSTSSSDDNSLTPRQRKPAAKQLFTPDLEQLKRDRDFARQERKIARARRRFLVVLVIVIFASVFAACAIADAYYPWTSKEIAKSRACAEEDRRSHIQGITQQFRVMQVAAKAINSHLYSLSRGVYEEL